MAENREADSPSAPDAPAPDDSSPSPRRKRWVRWARAMGVLSLAALVMGAIGVGSAEYYTSRPDFCGTCHIMDPYYESWSHDIHGTKIDVWCVECHYAPGEQHTIKAKFKGLSQLASYFSGRYGAGRPRAHVDDASCLRSNCHGDAEHMDKIIPIGEPRMEKRIVSGFETQVQRSPTVRFVHGKHLQTSERMEETKSLLAECAERLRNRLTAEAFAQVEETAKSVKPAAARKARMRSLVENLGAPEALSDALELMRLEHVRLRLTQLAGLNCAACHSYDATGKHHFAVDQQTCFVCHFTNQGFNQDTGECLRCHEPPTRKIAVHSPLPGASGSGTVEASTPVLMDHLDIVNRGIDCASCHLDVIGGSSEVTVRECTHCHDQQRYLDEFARRTTKEVEEYHRVHVAAQRARCPDCHRPVEHRLVDPTHVGTSQGFLKPVIDDCQHCHPGHHREQVELLMGTGGSGVHQVMPNAMFGSRLNCQACHTQPGSDFKGDPLIKATQDTCVACHGDDYRRLFDQWVSELKNSLEEAEAAFTRVEARVRELEAAGQQVPAEVRQQVEQARQNLQLVRGGNGIHNKNYALQLLDLCVRDLDAAGAALSPQ